MEHVKKDKKEEWQDTLPMEGGTHPSFENYSEEANRFIDHLKARNVARFYFGFAWENDESHCRHVSYDTHPVGDDIGQGSCYDLESLIDNTEWAGKDWTPIIYDLFEEQACDDALYCLHVAKREMKHQHALYVTEPKLIDEDGEEMSWNAY
jgi:hypothetical protein